MSGTEIENLQEEKAKLMKRNRELSNCIKQYADQNMIIEKNNAYLEEQCAKQAEEILRLKKDYHLLMGKYNDQTEALVSLIGFMKKVACED